MDLALAFGNPDVESFKRSLSELDMQRWFRYASKIGLPWRRIELYLAQLTLYVAKGPLSGELNLDDFVLDFVDEDNVVDDQPDIEAMRAAIGWEPPEED